MISIIYIIGIIAGLILPLQTSVNTNLGNRIKGTPFIASMFSFLIGTLSLFIIALFKGIPILIPLSTLTNQTYLVWIGGALGAVILTLLGNLSCGVVFDKFGLMGTTKKNITIVQYLGLLVMILGVVLVHTFKNFINIRKEFIYGDYLAFILYRSK